MKTWKSFPLEDQKTLLYNITKWVLRMCENEEYIKSLEKYVATINIKFEVSYIYNLWEKKTYNLCMNKRDLWWNIFNELGIIFIYIGNKLTNFRLFLLTTYIISNRLENGYDMLTMFLFFFYLRYFKSMERSRLFK